MLLKPQQQEVIDYYKDLIENKKLTFQNCLLTGGAGVGKTWTLVQLIKYLKKHLSIQILAPTHQASIVIENMLKENEIDLGVSTIHSYFNITPDIDDKGSRIFVPKLKTTEITADFFIIDEVSMIDPEILKIINEKLKLFPILFVGDKYQLPPVKHQYSPVFQLNFNKIFELTEIIRMSKSIESIEKIRQSIIDFENKNKKLKMNEIKKILDNFNTHNESEFPEFFNKYVKDFKNKKRIKIGSFTNYFVNYYNIHFRNFDDEVEDKIEDFSKGDKLIFNEPYNFWILSNPYTKTIIDREFLDTPNFIRNGQELKLDKVKDKELYLTNLRVFVEASKKLDFISQCLDMPEMIKELFKDLFRSKLKLKVKLGVSGTREFILPNELITEFKRYLFLFAKEYTIIEKNKGNRKKLWKAVYNLSDKFANCSYAYASTIHKLQGQTLDNVFLDIRDFLKLYDNDYNLFLRLLYVGITRAKHEINILY